MSQVMNVGVMNVGVINVGVMNVGVMNVGQSVLCSVVKFRNCHQGFNRVRIRFDQQTHE